jgi:hypothetical protein
MRNANNSSSITRSRLRRAAVESLEARQLLSGYTGTPYLGTPWGINQIIPAAEYDKGGEGVAYHDTTPTNLGNDTLRGSDAVDISTGGLTGNVVSHTDVGEYLTYTVKVPTTQNYLFLTSLSNTAAGATFHVDFNGKNLTGTQNVVNTGNFNTYTTIASGSFSLAAGTYQVQLFIDTLASNSAGGNFDCFNLQPNPLPKGTKDTPFTTAFTTSTKIPMAQYDRGGPEVAYHDTTPANFGTSTFRQPDAVDISTGGSTGEIVGFTAATEWLDYTINVPTAGMYDLQTSLANPVGGAQFHAEVAGKNLTGEISTPATADFKTFASVTSTPFALSAGTQVLRIVFDKAATNGAIGNFDTLDVLPFVPTPETPFTTAFGTNKTIPAANYDKGGEGVAYHDTTAANLGNSTYRSGDSVDISSGGTTGHIVGFTAPTEYLKYSLSVATAGMYTLQASVANPASGAQFHAMVGTTNLTGAVNVAATAGFTTFATDTSTPFALAAGAQVLQIVLDKAATNGAIGNFDYFKLVPFSAPVEAPFTSAFKVNTIIPAANFNKGGEGVAYHDTTPTNLGNDNYRPGEAVDIKTGGTTGHLVGYTAAGEWLDYTINVTTAGNYKLQASVANPASGATFHVAVGGKNLSGPIAVTPTADFNTFATDTSSSFALAAGTQVIRIFLDTAATNGAVGNFDWFKIVAG